MNWLQEHMEGFVKPRLGYIPSEPLKFFTPSDMAAIKNVWRSVKREARGRTILLPGRDVFVFEILARREDYPTLFRPDCSRQTVSYMTIDTKNMFLLDTGFAGTIPVKLNARKFKLISYCEPNSIQCQVFPNLGWARALALRIEETPKYWESARMDWWWSHTLQPPSSFREFERAARLTLAVYKDSTSRKTWTPSLRKPGVVSDAS